MILTKAEQDEFFLNYLPLLFYAATYEGFLPAAAKLADFILATENIKFRSRQALFADPEILVFFEQDNRHLLNESNVQFIKEVRQARVGSFVAIKELSDGLTICLETETTKFYKVCSLTEPISKMIRSFPAHLSAVIFNFKNRIVCDGMIIPGKIIPAEIAAAIYQQLKIAEESNSILEKVSNE